MMWLGTTLTSVTIYSQLLVVQNGFTVVYFVQGSAKGDYCEYDTNHTVDHCRLQVNSQWSTARRRVMLGTPVMPITVYSRLPVVQYGCRVVYFGEWDANGDYIDMYCNDWLPETGRPYRLSNLGLA